ncbi:hypothetical protein LUZ60_004086 [Juncus effusus]|nr:hypothetical protein LUZ60_004086 [Juncus effusus]
MVTESPLSMLSEMSMRERDLDLFRSGSAPPSLDNNNVLGLQNGAQNGFLSEEELRSDPAYHSYYYSHVNLNPRLPPPLLSKEDWTSVHRFGGGASSGDLGDGRRLAKDGSVFGASNGGVARLPALEVGRQKGFSEIFQDSFSYPNPNGSPHEPNHHHHSSIPPNGSNGSPHTYPSILGSPLSRSESPDPELIRRVPSPCLPPIGVKLNPTDKRISANGNGSSSFSTGPDSLLTALSGLKLQSDGATCRDSLLNQSSIMRSYLDNYNNNSINSPVARNNYPQLLDNNYTNMNNGSGLLTRNSNIDPLYLEYLRAAQYASQISTNSDDQLLELLRLQQKRQQQNQYGYYNSNIGLGYSPLGSPVGPGSPLRHADRSSLMRFPSAMRNFSQFVGLDDFAPSLLEEFKSNKTRCYELSEIAGHVVEFSADQYGSRFIQQKLETATNEEKDMVYEEIMPHALTLMTDVFGNYVVQKFFEHGNPEQIKELADQLTGRVLALSLQMYGCRVIQKAIEVVGLDQQRQMVAELDGHVMRCVRDQNGNHVIQKCIECVPQDVIHFIVSTFYGQVVVLSTHAYGCRVIQRVLEHCDDPKTQQIMMDEILDSVCLLAQDQYGNYVVQHVLEHGKPEERSLIIEKLVGQIVQMSQQKFASNVVEKCLSFGTAVERQLIIAEMLGPTEENEALQAMMKDQFGNYVVQKVLETCSDQQREMILTRIKIHLTALKKYTYGKHIVARVEKLVTAGERRLGMQAGYNGNNGNNNTA